MTELWTVKHAPQRIDDVAGNDEVKAEVRKWALDWDRGKKGKPLLLSGPTGCGKTSLAVAVAKEMGWTLVETNAGDLRNAENLKKLLGFASSAGGLFGEKRLLLVDEVDSAFDRGEVPALSAVLRQAEQPVVLTANDVWNPKLAPLRALCQRLEMRGVAKVNVRRVLQRIAEKEGLEVGEALAENASGDLRSALVDLQAGHSGERNRQENVFECLKDVFKAKTFSDAVAAGDSLDIDFDLFVAWLEENIPNEYEKAEDVASAYDCLSRADVFSGRIMRRQNFSLMKYYRVLSLAGVALSKREAYRKFTRYQFPSAIKRLGDTKKSRSVAKSVALKMGGKLHCSSREARGSFPLLALSGAKEYFGLGEEEASLVPDYLGEDKKRKNRG